MRPMHAKLIPAVALLGLLLAAPAQAGGLGAFNQTGLHFGEALRAGGGTATWLDEGGGVELTLGYEGKRVHARLRLSYTAIVDLGGGVQHAGLFAGGVSIQLLKDLERRLGLYLFVDMGVSPLVTHMRAFVFGDLGVGLSYRVADRVRIFGELAGLVRFEKTVAGGPVLYLGVRFSFD